jgi:hypothetical protein
MPYLNESKHALCFAFARVPSKLLQHCRPSAFGLHCIRPQSLQLHHLQNSHSALTRGARPHFKNNILLSKDRAAENHRKMRRGLTVARAHQAPNIGNRV